MRRFKSLISAFGVGFLWAGAGAVAAVGVHAYLAPPSNDQSSEHIKSVGDIIPGIARWAQSAYSGDVAGEKPQTVVEAVPGDSAIRLQPRNTDGELREAQLRVAQHQADQQAQRVLTRSIQQELQRVGCYAGAVDGNWSEGTRVAMSAFNQSVRVKLPLNSPDYILLTMLQGHASGACKNDGDTSVVASRAPSKIRRDTATAKAGDAWTTVVTAPAKSLPPTKSAASGVASPAAAPSTSQIVVTSTERSAPELPRTMSVAVPAVPLSGRMAVGAPLARPDGAVFTSLPQPESGSVLTPRDPVGGALAPQALPPTTARVAPRAADPVRVSAPSPRRQESSGSSSRSSNSGGRSPFSNLSSNAP